MKVATFGRDFKLSIPPTGKQITVLRNKKYIFSDFVLKTFIDNIVEKGGQAHLKEMITNIEEIHNVFPVLDLGDPIEELKKIHTLVIIRTGGIGDLLALSNVAKLATHIFRDVLKVPKFKVFFVTDNKYGAVFRYFEQMVFPIYYFYDSIDTVLKKNNIFGTKGVRCTYFEGVIEEREDNWFDLQTERLNLRKFALKDQIDPEYLVKNPKLVNIYNGNNGYNTNLLIEKMNINKIKQIFNNYKKNGTKTILIHHRASAWIRSFNLGDVINAILEYFNEKQFDNYKIIIFSRNFTKSDGVFIEELKIQDPEAYSKIESISTDNLHQFFYIVSNSDLVISSDTAAFHFREGIGGRAIGIYSSFPSRMRTKTYKNTRSYDILFNDCKFVCDKDSYIGCVSHFKTPYEICVYMSEKYKDKLHSQHHFIRGNRIPDKEFIKDLEQFVKDVGIEKLMDEGIFQYAPCLSSRWNDDFQDQIKAILEVEKIHEYFTE